MARCFFWGGRSKDNVLPFNVETWGCCTPRESPLLHIVVTKSCAAVKDQTFKHYSLLVSLGPGRSPSANPHSHSTGLLATIIAL